MQCKELYSYDYDPGFEVDIEQLLESKPGWLLYQPKSLFYIRTESRVIQIKERGFRLGTCFPEEMQEFVKAVKRCPKTPKTQEETLRIVHVSRVYIFQDRDDPFIMRPHLFESVLARTASTVYRLNNISIAVFGPGQGNGRVRIWMEADEKTMPDFDANWHSYMQNAEKTLLAAINAPDLLEENPKD